MACETLMSTNDTTLTERDQQDGGGADDGEERHPGYQETTKSAYGSNADARTAFREMAIKPSRTRSSSKLGKRFKRTAWYHYGSSFHAFQWPKGAGLTERTNRQNRGGLRFRCQDGEYLASVGVDQLYRFINQQGNAMRSLGLSQVVTEHGGNGRENAAIEFEDGTYVVVLYDASANAREGSTRAGMFVPPDDPLHTQVDRYANRGDVDKLSDLVAPDDVLASDLPVVDSKGYRQGNSENRYVPDNVGGYGDEESLGDFIIRQGEWYFIPEPDFDVPEEAVEKPLNGDAESPLGSHTPRDVFVDDPGQSSLDGETGDGTVHVRGTVRHRRNEHAMFNLYDMWHRVIENTEDMYVFEGRRGGRWE